MSKRTSLPCRRWLLVAIFVGLPATPWYQAGLWSQTNRQQTVTSSTGTRLADPDLNGHSEPPKLRPLNRIDVLPGAPRPLAASLPAAAAPQQKPEYGLGSPYAMRGGSQANESGSTTSNSGGIALLSSGGLTPGSSNASAPAGAKTSARLIAHRADQADSRTTNFATAQSASPSPSPPQVARRPIPNRGDSSVPSKPGVAVEPSELRLPVAVAPPADPPSLPLPGSFQRVESARQPSEQPIEQPSEHRSQAGVGLPPSSLRDSQRLMLRSPRVQVTLDGPSQVALGVPQAYQVVVQNTDPQSLEGLVLRMEVPAGVQVNSKSPSHGRCEAQKPSDGATLVNWVIDQLGQGGQASLPLEMTTNSSSNFAVSIEWTFQPFSAVADLQVLSPKLEMSLEGPTEVDYGQPSTYRLNICNPGSADASHINVTLTAERYGSSSTSIDRIAAGAEESMEVELVFNQAGPIRVAAMAEATGNLSSTSDLQVTVRQARLDLQWDAPEAAFFGTGVPYVLRVQNTGDAPTGSVRTLVQLPADAKLESIPQSAKMEDGQLSWEIPELAPGGSAELGLQLSLHREGDNELSAQSSALRGGSSASTTRTYVQAVSDLNLMVIDPAAPAMVGGEVVYELKLENRGSKAAEAVNVVALFSNDIEPIRAEGHGSHLFPGQVRFESIDRILPGESVRLQIVARAEVAGMHRFRAEVFTADTEIKLVQEETTQYLEAIRRTASSTGGSIVR